MPEWFIRNTEREAVVFIKTAFVIVFLVSSCKTTNITLKSTPDRPYASGALTEGDIEVQKAAYIKYRIDTGHQFNRVMKMGFKQGLHIFNTLKNQGAFSAGESFVQKITVTARNYKKNINHNKNTSDQPSVSLKDQNSKLIKSFSVKSGKLSPFDIVIPEFIQNENFFIEFKGLMEVTNIEIFYKRNFNEAAPDLARKGLRYLSEIKCGKTKTFWQKIAGTSSTIDCPLGKTKPKHVIMKKRFSKELCIREKVRDQGFVELTKTFNVKKKDEKFYLSVSDGCRGLFGVDLSRS